MRTRITWAHGALALLGILALASTLAWAANTFQDLSGVKYQFHNVQQHAAGDATQDHLIFRCATTVPCRVRKVTIVPGASITGAATNNFNLNVKSWTAAGSATERANRDYASGTNETAMVSRDLYAPAAPLSIEVGGHVTLERELVGTGLASPNIGVMVEWDN
jgi:hypothetical protein